MPPSPSKKGSRQQGHGTRYSGAGAPQSSARRVAELLRAARRPGGLECAGPQGGTAAVATVPPLHIANSAPTEKYTRTLRDPGYSVMFGGIYGIATSAGQLTVRVVEG